MSSPSDTNLRLDITLAVQSLPPLYRDVIILQTSSTAFAAAGKLGLRKLAEGEDGTGFIVLVDARTKTKLGKITANMTPDEMKSVFERVLKKTSARR